MNRTRVTICPIFTRNIQLRCFAARVVQRPSKSVTVVNRMADVVHRDVHRHQEHTDASGEEYLEPSGEADADYLFVRIGHRFYSCCSW